MKPWYEALFLDYAESYNQEKYIQGTAGEVDFFENEIGHDKSCRILDIGCGTGRHSIELAKRGYPVTGIDLSDSMLSSARKTAKENHLYIHFIRKDARRFDFRRKFGLAIMICEGAFPLMETDEMNYAILRNTFRSIRPGGKFIFTTLNGLFPLFHSVKDFINRGSVEVQSEKNTFDLMTFREHSVFKTKDDHGRPLTLTCNERYYVPSEITWLLKSIGFKGSGIYGCKQGAFSRKDPLTTEDFEMLVVAEK
jgi:2-polyprenyl-3-methyl-5-hydroxy-6-metoxy-1,4-benzoquinol methylase